MELELVYSVLFFKDVLDMTNLVSEATSLAAPLEESGRATGDRTDC